MRRSDVLYFSCLDLMEDVVQAGELRASVSAVLGILAFTAAAALLAAGTGTSNPDALNRPAKITIASAVLSTLILISAAMMFSTAAAAALTNTTDPNAVQGPRAHLLFAWTYRMGTCRG